MKLIIDIPDDDYEFIQNTTSIVYGGRMVAKGIQQNVINAIKYGKPVYEHERLKAKWIINQDKKCYQYECPFCNFWGTGDFLSTNGNLDLPNFCENCGCDMRKPNCVTCDHFGKCDGCEKGEEE